MKEKIYYCSIKPNLRNRSIILPKFDGEEENLLLRREVKLKKSSNLGVNFKLNDGDTSR
jgi:hypothetical protein